MIITQSGFGGSNTVMDNKTILGPISFEGNIICVRAPKIIFWLTDRWQQLM